MTMLAMSFDRDKAIILYNKKDDSVIRLYKNKGGSRKIVIDSPEHIKIYRERKKD